MSVLDQAREFIRGREARIVIADGSDARAAGAAAILAEGRLARPILLGSPAAVEAAAKAAGVPLDGCDVRDPATDPHSEAFAAGYHERRRHKGLSQEQALARVREPHYFGALLVATGAADGMVSGLSSATKPFLPAFEIVGLAPGQLRASSLFVMSWPERTLFYADCSLNIAPDSETLAGIGRATAATVRAFGHEPRVAFLSFSTRDSARHESIDRVKQAVTLLAATEPDLILDGEMQFDAAFVPDVFRLKCPDSPLAGQANVFIFPDLNAGNIAYKITERLAGARAIGPLMQGLDRPVHDLSRGATAQNIADVAVVAALQSLRR